MRVKEIFATVQGEGSKAGVPAVFVRLTGCNLWSGNFKNRKGVGECAKWCDTDFFRGEKKTTPELISIIENLTKDWYNKTVVITGGEPTLQLKKNENLEFILTLITLKYTVCIETNGTLSFEDCPILETLYYYKKGHITVSPKALQMNIDKNKASDISHLKLREGTDLKVIVPTHFNLWELKENTDFSNYYVQPMDNQDGTIGKNNLDLALELAKKYGYKLSVQTHKLIGLP
jgi:7-carboxy-7-deazaguanine synthase